MGETSIEWTDATWNPVRGCTKISPGCKHCYAEAFAERFRGVPGHPYEQGFDLRLVPEKLEEPLGWRKPRRVFVNSMSDLFHEAVPHWYVWNVLGVIECSRSLGHIFQVLTKRAARMRQLMNEWAERIDYADDKPGKGGFAGRYRHLWLGVSVEDRQYGLPRIEELRNTRASVRFLSIEPLLEDPGDLDLTGIHWVIVGGESGRGARPFVIQWARSILAQCRKSGVPCFVKQLGGHTLSEHRVACNLHTDLGRGRHLDDGQRTYLLRDRKGGDPAEWPEDLRVREFPRVA